MIANITKTTSTRGMREARIALKMALSSFKAMMCLSRNLQAWITALETCPKY